MSQFQVIVTRNVTESTFIKVDADSAAEAEAKALEEMATNGTENEWTVDDGSWDQDSPYVTGVDPVMRRFYCVFYMSAEAANAVEALQCTLDALRVGPADPYVEVSLEESDTATVEGHLSEILNTEPPRSPAGLLDLLADAGAILRDQARGYPLSELHKHPGTVLEQIAQALEDHGHTDKEEFFA